jgi:hypothetical protein
VRREDAFFEDRELDLVYIARKLNDAQTVESLLTEAGYDYYVETDEYMGGVLFPAVRMGAFFYVPIEQAEETRALLRSNGFKPEPAIPKES